MVSTRLRRFLSGGLVLLMGLSGLSIPAAGRPPQNFDVLLYTSPDRYHNQALPTAITKFEQLAEKHFFDLTWTQLPSDLNVGNLAKYEVVVFLYANARELGSTNMAALRSHLRDGGGFVGVHASSVDSDQDPWFKRMIGRSFRGHPEKQSAVIRVVDRDFPANLHLPARWLWTDEWYEFGEPLVDDLHVVLTVDETTYAPLVHTDADGHETEGMGGDHPIAWYHEYEGGRVFYTALGHLEAAYTDAWFLQHLYGGIYWAATGVVESAVPASSR